MKRLCIPAPTPTRPGSGVHFPCEMSHRFLDMCFDFFVCLFIYHGFKHRRKAAQARRSEVTTCRLPEKRGAGQLPTSHSAPSPALAFIFEGFLPSLSHYFPRLRKPLIIERFLKINK